MAKQGGSRGPKTQWGRIQDLAQTDPAARQAAWDHLVTTYRSAWVNYARWLLARAGRGQDAEDVIQDVLVRCVEKGWLSRADPRQGRFRDFARVVVERACRDHLHKVFAEKRTPEGGPPVSLERILEGPAAPEAERAFHEGWTACLLEAAIARVRARSPDSALVAALLRERPGTTTGELERLLGWEGTRAAGRVFQARRMLAEEIWAALKQTISEPGEREAEKDVLAPWIGGYLDPSRNPSYFGRAGEARGDAGG